MRNATSILLFGASALALTLIGACGGGGDGSRPDGTAGTPNNTAGALPMAGSLNGNSGAATTGGNSSAGASAGGAPTCSPLMSPKKGEAATTVIDEIDDTNTMFATPGMATGSW